MKEQFDTLKFMVANNSYFKAEVAAASPSFIGRETELVVGMGLLENPNDTWPRVAIREQAQLQEQP